jgi:LacI family transcriptional regulator
MSMQRVAQLAGVSTSTVSRVVNNHPRVAADTAATVRQAMRKLSFRPITRHRGDGAGARAQGIALLVIGTSGSKAAPAFGKLLQGVSAAVNEHGLSLSFSFVSDPSHLPSRVEEGGVDGLLLHGERPGAEVLGVLRKYPTVWLMANRQRPQWGDQVMPDSPTIGEMAAKYLIRRGHRRVAYLGRAGSWSMQLRAFAFAQAAADVGAEARVLEAVEAAGTDFWRGDGLPGVAAELVGRLTDSGEMPTGLFIAEDRLLPAVDLALRSRGVRTGAPAGRPAGGGVEIISCNNEQPHFVGLQVSPATIDIGSEAIGRLGVEQLLWRMRNPGVPERVRVMVEPVLIEPELNRV